MKGLAIFIIVVLAYNIVADFYQIKQDELDEIYHNTWQQKALEKYKWKSDRLRTYTDLVYNVKGGAVYEK